MDFASSTRSHSGAWCGRGQFHSYQDMILVVPQLSKRRNRRDPGSGQGSGGMPGTAVRPGP